MQHPVKWFFSNGAPNDIPRVGFYCFGGFLNALKISELNEALV